MESKHVRRLPLRHCYVASTGATKLDKAKCFDDMITHCHQVELYVKLQVQKLCITVLHEVVACYVCDRITAEDMEELKQIGTSFAAETNQRDEDAEM